MKTIFRNSVVIVVLIIILCLPITSGIINLRTPESFLKNNDSYSSVDLIDYDYRSNAFMNFKLKHLIEILNDRFSKNNREIFFDGIIKILMNLAHMSALTAAIVKDNELVWTKGYGLSDRENGKNANDETIYLVASISKSFTATAIMQLYEKGLFDLDDDVNNYLPFSLRNPNYPDKPITFRMLLAHHSSISKDNEGTASFITRIIPGGLEITGYPSPYLREYLVPGGVYYKPQVWLDLQPGQEMHYANVGYSVLGYLVEILSGKSFENYCQENIFKPLDMDNTSFRFSFINESRAAVPYEFVSGKYLPIIPYDLLDSPPGGLRTSVLDLSHFLIAIINGGVYKDIQILNESTVELMQNIQYPDKDYSFQYGLGFQIWETPDDVLIGHSGGLFGVSTKMVFRKSDDIGVIFFTTKAIVDRFEGILFSLIEQFLFWRASGFKDKINIVNLKQTIESNELLLNDLIIN
jgi:CubicO group peptidase (beta-lactamase class C family)